VAYEKGPGPFANEMFLFRAGRGAAGEALSDGSLGTTPEVPTARAPIIR
jgi:hypothetical protein